MSTSSFPHSQIHLPLSAAGERLDAGWISNNYNSSPNIGARTIPTRNVAFKEIGGFPDDLFSPLGGAAASEGDAVAVAVVDTVADVSVTDFAPAVVEVLNVLNVLDVLDVLVLDGFEAPSPLA